MQLTIENVKTNPSGKSCVVKAGGKDYLAKPTMGLAPGMTIEAELKESFFNGKTNVWIEKYKAVNGSAAPQTGQSLDASPKGGQAASAGAAPAWLPFASNTVAHAINAGLVTTPEQVKLWAAAAKQAFTELA
jgi:hypothetical protein